MLVIGTKGVGKSTFVKYLVNCILDDFHSNEDADSGVCLMDLDPGQPEQSLPSVISVSSISSPLLGPAHTYSLATWRSDAEIRTHEKVLARRRRVVENMRREKQLDPSAIDDTILSEVSELLEDGDILDDHTYYGNVTRQKFLGALTPMRKSSEYIDMVSDLMDTVNTKHSEEPLIVNTMGWLEGQGLIILGDVVKVVRPSHVLHLGCSNFKDLSCKKLENIYLENEKSFTFPWCRSLKMYRGFFYEYLQVQSNSPASSQFTPVFLRDLKFISYFSALFPLNTTVFNSKACKPVVELDYQTMQWYSVEFDAFANINPASQVGNIVVLCSLKETSTENDSSKFEDDNCLDGPKRKYANAFEYFLDEEYHASQMRNISKRCKASHEKREDLDSGVRHTSQLDCHGWAIVAGVNNAKQKLLLHCPISNENLTKVNVICVKNYAVKKFAKELLQIMFDLEL